MDENTPLVVPEVNEEDLHQHNGIIANPNCSTIQMVVALEPIRKAFGLNKVIVSTYQAVSGAGNEAIKELYGQTEAILKGDSFEPQIMPVKSDEKHYQIAFNAIPQIDKFQENGFTFEEMKMINETKKSCTCLNFKYQRLASDCRLRQGIQNPSTSKLTVMT